ncbi:MAG TPA: hypothetical protein VHG90_02435 [Acidimicrobiales bacterium]|nr:hypothetical protein [Acidimicrobiales bacterium]
MVEADSADEVDAMAKEDPAVKTGMYTFEIGRRSPGTVVRSAGAEA